MIRIINEGTIIYDFDDSCNLPYEFEFEFKEYLDDQEFSKEDKIQLINLYSESGYDSEADLDDQLSEIEDAYIKDHFDEIQDYYRGEAREDYLDALAYHKDPLGYNGLSIDDFI